MRIAVIGARGALGRRIVAEGLHKGHNVTGVVRRPEQIDDLGPEVVQHVADATDTEAITELGFGHDVLVTTTRPSSGHENDLVVAAKAMLEGAAAADVRILLVGGAGSLVVPGTAGRTVIDDPHFMHPAALPIAKACGEQLAACRAHQRADWTYLSPAASLQPGVRTGSYRLGTDELVVDSRGRSHISMEDLAVALLDEAEHPQHRGRRFTVAY
ncbi:MAG: NAD(P)H-binding protein [Actinomycetia bacterium]|nr:NAD(P)H-binding protein [Actinomycetes bacterium]